MATEQTNPETLPVKKSKSERLKAALDSPNVQAQFNNALKENKDSFVASLMDLYANDSKLQQCEPSAVILEALKAAVLKLPIIKSLGQAWIIPYQKSVKVFDAVTKREEWKKVLIPQFQMAYRGYIQLAMRTGHYKRINNDIVYDGEIKYKNKLTGEIDLTGEPTLPLKPVGYFAYIELMNGFSKVLYSTTDEVKAHAAKYSKSYNPTEKDNIWNKEFDAMAKKTVLSNLLNHYGYLSVEMQTAMANDFESDSTFSGSVQSEIRDNANQEEMAFDDAEDVTNDPEQNGSQQPEENQQQQLSEGQEQITVPITPAAQKEPISIKATERPGAAAKQQEKPNESGLLF